MQNSVAVARLTFSIFALLFLLYGVYWKKEPKKESSLSNSIEILCISEVGDTIARFETTKPFKIWGDSAVSCIILESTETEETVNIKPGTVIICQ